MSAKTKETIEMLENLLNSQITMGQVMDSILAVLDAPPAPMEELVEEVLQPMADAVRQAGSRLGLDFQAPQDSQEADWETQALIVSTELPPPSEEVMQQQQALDASMDDLMSSVTDMIAEAQKPTSQE